MIPAAIHAAGIAILVSMFAAAVLTIGATIVGGWDRIVEAIDLVWEHDA